MVKMIGQLKEQMIEHMLHLFLIWSAALSFVTQRATASIEVFANKTIQFIGENLFTKQNKLQKQ